MPVSDEDFNALKNSVRALADQINTFQASMGGLQNRIDALQSSMDEKFMAVSEKLDGAGKEIGELEMQASFARSNLNKLKRQMKGL
jgi:hypothetical protein|nr:hypothetical protein [uncultured Campylobacter sp.]DAP93751.1 MAG TPA: hemolytic enterotoxin [Caudoviricetes sp.]